MRFITCLTLCFFTALHVSGQTDAALDAYLATHKYTITGKVNSSLTPDNKLTEQLNRLIDKKPVILYGEGFSHNLHTNGYLEAMFIKHLTTRNLKYVFGEQARSWVVTDDFFYKDPNLTGNMFYPDHDPEIRQMEDVFKQIYQSGHFEFRAADFERPSGFRAAMDSILVRLPNDKKKELQARAPQITDTAYLKLSPGKFISFYEEQRDKFFKDSTAYKAILGQLYTGFAYLVGDPQPSRYADNRNKNMANHIAWQIGTPENNATYFVSCGAAHAQRGKRYGLRKTTAGKLEEWSALTDKVLIVNLYCESCTPKPTRYGVGDNYWLSFMKGAVQTSFQQAAAGQAITFFDLSELPKAFKYISDDYGDVLIYARGQK